MSSQVLISSSVGKKEEREGIAKIVRRLIHNNSLSKAYTIGFTLLLSYVALYSSIGNYLSSVLNFSPSEIFNIRAIGIMGMSGSLVIIILARVWL